MERFATVVSIAAVAGRVWAAWSMLSVVTVGLVMGLAPSWWLACTGPSRFWWRFASGRSMRAAVSLPSVRPHVVLVARIVSVRATVSRSM
jgi:hypothetical protein